MTLSSKVWDIETLENIITSIAIISHALSTLLCFRVQIFRDLNPSYNAYVHECLYTRTELLRLGLKSDW